MYDFIIILHELHVCTQGSGCGLRSMRLPAPAPAHCMRQQPNQIENLRINQSQPPRGYLTNRDALHFKLTTTPRASVIILALHCDSVSIAPVALADLNQFCAINAPPASLARAAACP